MKTVAIAHHPLSPDAHRALELFERYGRRRAGRGLRRSALTVLAEDPGFDLWAGLDELLTCALIREDLDRSSFVLTAEGAGWLARLHGAPPGPALATGPRRTRPGASGFAA